MDAVLYLIVAEERNTWTEARFVLGYCASKDEADSMVKNLKNLVKKYNKQWNNAQTDAAEKKASKEGRRAMSWRNYEASLGYLFKVITINPMSFGLPLLDREVAYQNLESLSLKIMDVANQIKASLEDKANVG